MVLVCFYPETLDPNTDETHPWGVNKFDHICSFSGKTSPVSLNADDFENPDGVSVVHIGDVSHIFSHNFCDPSLVSLFLTNWESPFSYITSSITKYHER